MNELIYWGGAICLLLLLWTELQMRLQAWVDGRKARRQRRKLAALDWKLIDTSLNSDRPRRDCEREESLGICTGRECLVYDSCDFNIKKVVH